MERNPAIADNHVAEATIWTKGPTLRAREAATGWEASIDQLVDKLERQVVRYREKRRTTTRAATTAARARRRRGEAAARPPRRRRPPSDAPAREGSRSSPLRGRLLPSEVANQGGFHATSG